MRRIVTAPEILKRIGLGQAGIQDKDRAAGAIVTALSRDRERVAA
jgi:hypothetical protein